MTRVFKRILMQPYMVLINRSRESRGLNKCNSFMMSSVTIEWWSWRSDLGVHVSATVLLSAPGGCKGGFHWACQTLLWSCRRFSQSVQWQGWVGGNDDLMHE